MEGEKQSIEHLGDKIRRRFSYEICKFTRDILYPGGDRRGTFTGIYPLFSGKFSRELSGGGTHLPIENGDGSILAFTVDHSKKNFPIDQYIEEEWKTGEHWKIESCGLVKYLVMRAIERDVSCIGLFSSCQEAEKAMLEDFCRVSDIPLKKVEARYYEETNELLDDEDNEFGFVQGEVWYNGSDNYDWKIERLLID